MLRGFCHLPRRNGEPKRISSLLATGPVPLLLPCHGKQATPVNVESDEKNELEPGMGVNRSLKFPLTTLILDGTGRIESMQQLGDA